MPLSIPLTVRHPSFALKRVTIEKVPGIQNVQLEVAAILEGRVIYADSGKPAAGATILIAALANGDKLKLDQELPLLEPLALELIAMGNIV